MKKLKTVIVLPAYNAARTLQKTIDKMAKVKFVKKNKASRLKSRLSKLIKNK